MGRLRTLAALPAPELNALMGAAVRLLGARVALALLPYVTVRRLYARPAGHLSPSVDHVAYRRRAVWSVRRAGRWVLGNRPCLAQALVAERALRRSGLAPEIKIGVAKGPGGRLLAHAWLECDGVVVLGQGSSPTRFATLRPLPPEGKAHGSEAAPPLPGLAPEAQVPAATGAEGIADTGAMMVPVPSTALRPPLSRPVSEAHI